MQPSPVFFLISQATMLRETMRARDALAGE
jgi:hypothetical protein